MGVIIGLVVGYVLGTRAGDEGIDELKDAWATIRASEEARDIAGAGMSMARNLLGKGGAMLADRLVADGHSFGSVSSLRPTG